MDYELNCLWLYKILYLDWRHLNSDVKANRRWFIIVTSIFFVGMMVRVPPPLLGILPQVPSRQVRLQSSLSLVLLWAWILLTVFSRFRLLFLVKWPWFCGTTTAGAPGQWLHSGEWLGELLSRAMMWTPTITRI